jgi:hypothetical protein
MYNPETMDKRHRTQTTKTNNTEKLKDEQHRLHQQTVSKPWKLILIRFPYFNYQGHSIHCKKSLKISKG